MSKNISEIEILHSIALYCEQYGNTSEIIRNNALVEAINIYKKRDHGDIQSLLNSLTQSEHEQLRSSMNYNAAQPVLPTELLDKISRDLDNYISESWIKNTIFTMKKIIPAIATCLILFFISQKLFFPNKWRATYFANTHLNGVPFGIYDENSPSNDWGMEAPKSGMSPNNFSIRYESEFELNSEETISFTVVADDGIRLFVDEELILDFWIPQDSIPRITNKTLKKGLHKVRLEYFEAEAGAKLNLLALNSNKKELKFKLPSK
jgi:hypothetical protein